MMFRLLKGLIFALLFLAITSPVFAAGSCEAPRPESPALSLLIKTAQKRGGAAANVPASMLKAIYLIEGSIPYSNPGQYTCKANTSGALGLMQMKDGEYKMLTPDSEETKDAGACQQTDCKLSRCNASDAIELAARLLLYKVGLWDNSANKPLGKITTKEQVYNASCGYYGTFSPDYLTNQLSAYVGKNPHDGNLSYCEFVGLYSGFYSTDSLPWPRGGQPLPKAQSPEKFTFNACKTPQEFLPSAAFDFHPLRPDPKDVKGAPLFTTPYCVMRPVPVEQNRLDKREPLVDLKTVGTLTQDFTKFVTPLLSITDPKKSDYSLPYNEKAQRYLADFLEGRAYYEPLTETTSQQLNLQTDLFNRLGVFRKLAPASYQDELKRAVILRAANQFNPADNPYGFDVASERLHNYVVGYWDNGVALGTDAKRGEKVTLKDYFDNQSWAPLTQDLDSISAYSQAYGTWKNLDGGKWYRLWPYVPMFTREDSKGTIKIVDSNSPPNPAPLHPPGSTPIEKNTSSKTSVDVYHPHLARTYEVSTTLSYLLTPQSVHETAKTPELKEEWLPRIWENNNMWLDPSYFRPQTNEVGVEVGPVCDVDPSLINPINSSGDLAYDSIFTTNVDREDLKVKNPEYDPAAGVKVTDDCGTHDACEKCKPKYIRRTDQFTNVDTVRIGHSLDDSGCFAYKNVRSSPDYLISYTPYLNEIVTSLVGSDRAVFDLFKPAGTKKQPYEQYSWPGVGNAGEESPVYDYKAASKEHSRAEAGAMKPGDSQSYYYRYLGSIQCAKEHVLQVLQPFISGQPYEPYAPECFGLPPKTPTGATAGPDSETAPDSYDPNMFPFGTPNLSGLAGACPKGGQEITDELATKIPGGEISLLPNSNGARKQGSRICIKPTMLVIHWSGGWDNKDGNQSTYETLVQRDLACQLATDIDDAYLMQPFYEKQVEMAWCANSWNTYSINNEMAGGFIPSPNDKRYGKIDIRFTDSSGNPQRVGDPSRPNQKTFPEEVEIKRAVDTACVMMKQYNIPWTQIFGHYQVPGSGKEDPGQTFLENTFIPRVRKQCPATGFMGR